MGKASKRVKRNMHKKNNEAQMKQCQTQERELEQAFDQEKYADVLNILAELITANDVKPDFLYKGAYSYFMLGDYERAAQWVNNTLNFDPQNVEARILLARLCFIQNRQEDGLSIYDFLAANYQNSMTKEQKEQITDSSAYYVRREGDKLRQKYPHLAEFLQLKENAAEKTEPARTADTGSSALSALQRLKAKLEEVQAKNNKQAESETHVDGIPKQEETVTDKLADVSIEQQIVNIQNRTCSLREKVQILNKFAAAAYMAADYAGAMSYLQAALQLDDGDSQTIRNMAMAQAAFGEADKAQAIAAKLPEVDFVLLYLLKEQGR
ncbi:Anaphase-promoting complex, cyclosome, subunit 3 [Selenomonas ruminantium]|uniref:Anaphase-promoting complex, cyclosome, subunit 3 n=2 Tax=Selenomonas ruminantium TaxID=971 RepID=A0A1H0RIA9_SELRU|nr:Anaphase-promoting complex, cyclosome, subunit 3 [Selenomonas ruminantium]